MNLKFCFHKQALYAFFCIHYLYVSAILITLFMFTVNIPWAVGLDGVGDGVVIAACLAEDVVVFAVWVVVVVLMEF